MNSQHLHSLINTFPKKRIAVIGDLMIDRYIWGHASRISQEAPVPVVAVNRRSAEPGGAANVLRNLASLGAQPLAFGVIGDDLAGHELSQLLNEQGVNTDGIIFDQQRVTTEKTRIISDHQQVVRVDTEVIQPLEESHVTSLINALDSALQANHLDAIIIEDYDKGTVTESLLNQVCALGNQFNKPIALDPHPGNTATAKGITVMTPNRGEAFAMSGHYPKAPIIPVENDTALQQVVDTLQSTWASKYLLITLGAEGMALFQQNEDIHHIPTQAREVFDVSGAGDTVIASFVLSLVAGATPDEAAAISNHAAGVVVAKVGTARVNTEELIQAFRNDE